MNKKSIVVFVSFAAGITSYLFFLLFTNHTLVNELGLIPYWSMIIERMSLITADFFNPGTYLFLGIAYFALILIIGFLIIKNGKTNIIES